MQLPDKLRLTLAKHYSKSSSSINYCDQFQAIKDMDEQNDLDFSSPNYESYKTFKESFKES